MKKSILLFLILAGIMLAGMAQEPSFVNQSTDQAVRPDPRTSSMDFVPGEILVKFKDDVQFSFLKSGGILKTANTSLNKILGDFQITEVVKLFPTERRLKSKEIFTAPTGQQFERPSLHNIYTFTLSNIKSSGSAPPDIFQAIKEFKAMPEVEYAEPNYIFSIGDFTPVGPEMTMAEAMKQPDNAVLSSIAGGLVPNDPLYNSQWGIPATNIDEVWNTTTGDSTSIIAILDTGVDWLHPDLAANNWTNKQELPNNGKDDDGNGKIDDIRGWDFINNDNNPTDDNSHGTHCAGIAAAVGNNGIGIAGVNWHAKIMPIKVFQSSGRGDAATIAMGVSYAVNNGASVLNMSFGSYAESLTLKNALANAYATAILVAAAGNDATPIGPCDVCAPMYPGAYSFVLGVEANKQTPAACEVGGPSIIRACFSNFDQDGPVFSGYADLLNYELKAPGTGILSCVPGGNYREYNGTSMAAPLVAGAVSLYRKLKPTESQELLFGNFINSINQHIDLQAALNIIPEPKLQIVSYELQDTIDGDRDGRPDAGETIEIKVKVRNTWGQANDVKVGIEFGEFEDHSTATILTPVAGVASISAYATRTNMISLKLKIGPNVAHNRDIVFKLKSWYGIKLGLIQQQIVLNVENGEELSGVLSTTKTITADKLWLISGSFKIAPSGILIIKPGTHLTIKSSLINDGTIIGIGKPDSIIYITGTSIQGTNLLGKLDLKYNDIKLQNQDEYLLSCIFQESGKIELSKISLNAHYGFYRTDIVLYDCIHYNSGSSCSSSNSFIRTNFDYINDILFAWTPQNVKYCNFIHTNSINSSIEAYRSMPNFQLGNNILTGHNSPSLYAVIGYEEIIPNQYWGTTNLNFIENKIFDFNEDARLAAINSTPYLNQPSDSAHACVWKALINGKDAQDEVVEPAGVGRHRFDIYFNRPMDKTNPPELTFGVREPFNQQIVNEDGSWSENGRIYTVYKTVKLTTGDGINRIRVSGAKEANGWDWEIPVEDQRFEFLISAASSASNEFMAIPGLGKVALEWNNNDLDDGLGFNMYRMELINDSTLTTPLLINSTLIPDTLYTDYSVIPNKKYFYYYKIVRTNLTETDSSKVVSAMPFTASKGDANGDLAVNVLDITSIVSYLLNQNPQPFIFEAADVNSDKVINILDVIGAVNKITGGGKKSVARNTNIPPAYIYLDKNEISFKTQYPVSALQFELEGNGIENITLSSKQQGFELVYSNNEGKIRGILFSFDNKPLPSGMADIIDIQGDCSGLKWGTLLGGDAKGNPVKVIPDELHSYSLADCNLIAFPNPFNQSTTISYNLYEAAHVQLEVYDMYGKQVQILLSADQPEGTHQIIWKGSNATGIICPQGFYFCRLKALSISGNAISKTTKLLRIGQ